MAAGSTPSTIGVPKHAHLEGLFRHACGGFFCSERHAAARVALSRQGASMVFAVVVLLYYWSTGGEIWYSASIGRRELGLRAGTTGEARCALTAHQRSQPPTLLG